MKLNIKGLKGIFKSKALLGSLFFAVALWTYTSLNADYITTVKIPLVVKLPDNRSIENPIPSNVSLEVRGTGWHLFNLLFFNSSVRCFIDLSLENIESKSYEITRTDMLKNIQSLVNVEAKDILPQSITVRTGKTGEYAIPVESLVKIMPREGFIIVGKVVIKPDIIVIHGNDKFVKNIKKWFTKPLEIKDVYEALNKVVPLSDSLSNIVTLSQDYVTIQADIQQAAEVTIPDVGVYVKGGVLPTNEKLIPERLSITIRGGINQLNELSSKDVIARLYYSQILTDSTGLLKPEFILPENLEVISSDPPFIQHIKDIKPGKSFQ